MDSILQKLDAAEKAMKFLAEHGSRSKPVDDALQSSRAEILALRKQRDELLAACKQVLIPKHKKDCRLALDDREWCDCGAEERAEREAIQAIANAEVKPVKASAPPAASAMP